MNTININIWYHINIILVISYGSTRTFVVRTIPIPRNNIMKPQHGPRQDNRGTFPPPRGEMRNLQEWEDWLELHCPKSCFEGVSQSVSTLRLEPAPAPIRTRIRPKTQGMTRLLGLLVVFITYDIRAWYYDIYSLFSPKNTARGLTRHV